LFTYIQPIYIQQLGASPVQIGTVLALAGLAMTAAFLPGGILSDRIPRKIILLSGWMLGIVGVLTMAWAHDWRTFTPGIMLYSFSAFCVPAISATVADAAGGAPLARVITFVYAGYSAGSIISPAVGGWLAQMTNMRTVYLIAAVCYAVSTLVVLMIKPQPASPSLASPHRGALQRPAGSDRVAMFLPLYIAYLRPTLSLCGRVAGGPDRLLGTLPPGLCSPRWDGCARIRPRLLAGQRLCGFAGLCSRRAGLPRLPFGLFLRISGACAAWQVRKLPGKRRRKSRRGVRTCRNVGRFGADGCALPGRMALQCAPRRADFRRSGIDSGRVAAHAMLGRCSGARRKSPLCTSALSPQRGADNGRKSTTHRPWKPNMNPI
jgi:MFS family permease